jgi:hypothetical protein
VTRRLTASQLGRVKRCPASAVLPHLDIVSDAAMRGTAVHAFLENIPRIGRDTALEAVPEPWRPLCDAIDIDALPTDLAAEVTFAYDPRTSSSRELGRNLDRDYSGATDDEIVGTADVLGLSPSSVFVADWKTGWGDVEPAATNDQVKFLALAAARAYHRGHAIVEIIRIRDNGAAWRDRAEFDIFELDTVAFDLRVLVGATTVDTPRVSPGPWCQYCPAFAACPAKTALLVRLADGTEAQSLELMLPLTQEMASVAYQRLQHAKQLLKRVESALYEFASREPIPIGDGRWFGRVTEDGNEQLDGDVVWTVLSERYGTQIADHAVQRTATKSRVREVIRSQLTEPRTLSKTERAVLQEVRARGGASRPTRTSITEYMAANDDKETTQ